MMALIFSLHLISLLLSPCLVMSSWECLRRCLNTWPINSRCVDPGVGTSLSFLRCTSIACHWSVHYRTTTVCTRRLPEALHPSRPSQEKIDPSFNFWQWTCSVVSMPRVKACHGISCNSTYQSSRFCFNQPEVAGSGSRLGPNMFAVPLKPALGTVNLHGHPDPPEAAVGQLEATEVVLVDSQCSDIPSSSSVVHPNPLAPRETPNRNSRSKIQADP